MLRESEGTVCVWVAPQFVARKKWDDYLRETYNGGNAISAFCRDCGETFYDHDVQEAVYRPKRLALDELIRGCSYRVSFISSVISACEEEELSESNAALLLYNLEFVGTWPSISLVHFMGAFDFDASVVDPTEAAKEAKRRSNSWMGRKVRHPRFGVGEVVEAPRSSRFVVVRHSGEAMRIDKAFLEFLPDQD